MDYQLVLDSIILAAREADDAQPFEDALSVLPPLLERRPVVETAYARYLCDLATAKVVEFGTRIGQSERLMRFIESALLLNAPHDLDSYLLFTEWNREPEKRYWQPRRHVLLDVCMGFQALADDLIDVLVVSLPPRVGKSTLGVFALTWQMGREPLSANLMSGHSDTLTKGFHQEALVLEQ